MKMSEEKTPSVEGGAKAGEPAAGSDVAPRVNLDEVFKIPVIREQREDMLRYKEERNSLKEKLAAYEAEKAKAAEEGLKEKEEWKTLYEKEKSVRESLETSVRQEKILGAIRAAAVKAGVQDPADPNFSAPQGVEIGEDGTVKGAEEFVQKVVTARPYLLGEKAPQTFGGQPVKKVSADIKYEDLMKDTKKMSQVMSEQPDVYKALKEDYFNRKLKR